jgi:hypothetical protein
MLQMPGFIRIAGLWFDRCATLIIHRSRSYLDHWCSGYASIAPATHATVYMISWAKRP